MMEFPPHQQQQQQHHPPPPFGGGNGGMGGPDFGVGPGGPLDQGGQDFNDFGDMLLSPEPFQQQQQHPPPVPQQQQQQGFDGQYFGDGGGMS